MNNQVHGMEVGVVGLGLMGSSIIVSLLLAGHQVKAIAPIPEDLIGAGARIGDGLHHCHLSGLCCPAFDWEAAPVSITTDYGELKNCKIVFECVIEDIEIKAAVYKKIAQAVAADVIIATNTSAIAVSILQQQVPYPERFLGVHWAEPAYATRFMEITCGAQTCAAYAEWVFELAAHWGKEPTLLRKDIKGFITNRLMYAVYREIFYLVDHGHATLEDVDKAFRYDAGSWMTFMGIFRRMDFVGLTDCAAIFKTLFPQLSNKDQVPPLMQQMVECHARGTQNGKGLYSYSPKEAKEWEAAFTMFNKDIFKLASLYPSAKMVLPTENV